jgi:hypothetical protein
MDVIGFLYVSLGSRHACAYSEAGFSSQNGDCLRSVLPKISILWARGLDAKYIHKEMFPVYSGKCLLCKAVYNWVEKFS